MNINNYTDLINEIFIYNKENKRIRLIDVDEFEAIFYTTDINSNLKCSFIKNGTSTNITFSDDKDYCNLNAAEENKLKNGIIKYQYTYSIEDSDFSDGYFNSIIDGETNYYFNIKDNNGSGGGTTTWDSVINKPFSSIDNKALKSENDTLKVKYDNHTIKLSTETPAKWGDGLAVNYDDRSIKYAYTPWGEGLNVNIDNDTIIYNGSNLSVNTDSEIFNSKQDKLIAGDNITIIDNVISSTASGSGSATATTAQKLATPRSIFGNPFDGTQDITGMTATGGNISGLTNLTMSGSHQIVSTTAKMRLGESYTTDKMFEIGYLVNGSMYIGAYLDSNPNKMFLKSGNFGFGTPIPTEKVDITGNLKISGNIINTALTNRLTAIEVSIGNISNALDQINGEII